MEVTSLTCVLLVNWVKWRPHSFEGFGLSRRFVKDTALPATLNILAR